MAFSLLHVIITQQAISMHITDTRKCNRVPITAAETEATFKATAEKLGIGAGQVMQLFRVSISGVGGGPALFEMIELLGKEEIINRLQTFSKINSL